MHPYSELPFLVVSGLGRSGTTVLRNCIAAHPSIEALNRESNHIFNLMRGAQLVSEEPDTMKSLVVTTRAFWSLQQQMILNLCWPKVEKTGQGKSAISTYSRLDPRAANGLAKAFRRLSIIYTVRNGIEVVSSFQAFGAFKHLSFADACRVWSLRHDMVQYCHDSPHATLVRYEWLSEDPKRWENTVEESLQQVGLEFHPGCRKPLSKKFHPTRFSGESRLDSKDPEKRKERWRLWSDDQRDTFVEICGETMQNLSYSIPWV